MTSASVTDAHQLDVAADAAGLPLQPSPVAPRTIPLRDATEAVLRRRARRQGLMLMIASSVAMIALIAGIWMSFR